MVSLRDVLFQAPLPNGIPSFHTLPGAGKPTLSQKGWVETYREVRDFNQLYINPTQDQINTVFGVEDALDDYLLNTEVSPLNGTNEWLQNEGDSVRTFHTKVSEPIQLAFQSQGTPPIIQRSESGPLGRTNVNQTIDFTWGCGDRCLVIGELKRHGIIDVDRWRGARPTDINRRWLGKELRGYCHKYKCFAASVFDGQFLLILIFQAESAELIAQQNCQVTGLLFSSNCETLRYGLFRTLTHQIRRMQADRAPAVILDGYIRRFEWWSGCPYWVNGNNEREQYPVHPNGYTRTFARGAWHWIDANGNNVLDGNGLIVWDTLSLEY